MYPATLTIARRIKIAFPDAQFTGLGAENLLSWCDRYTIAHDMRNAIEALPDVPGEISPSWHHQRRGFWFAFHLPAVLLSEKVGAGKTKQILDVCNVRDHKRVLVTTTASAVDDWPIHVAKHSTRPYAVLSLGHEYRARNSVQKAEIIKAFVAANEYAMVVLSYHSVYRPPLGALIGTIAGGTNHIGILAELGFDCLVLDEIHNASDPQGRRSLFLWRLAERIPHIIAATGSVIRHKPQDVFAVYRILDSGIFGTRKQDFYDRYCIFNRPSDEEIAAARKAKQDGTPTLPGMENIDNGDLAPRYIVGYKNTDELARMMSAVTFDPGEIDLHLPKPVDTTRRAFLGAKGQRAYNELAEQFATILDDGTEIVAGNVLTQMLRLHQCAGGFVGEPIINPETGEVDFVKCHQVDDAKEMLLEETIREIQGDDPIVLVGRFRNDIDVFRRVANRCGREVLEQSGRRKERIRWQQSRCGEILSAQIASACEAIDLTRSRYCIFYSVGFSKYQYEQMKGRFDRPGQTRQPNYIHLVSSGTIDERIYKAIATCVDIANGVMRQLRLCRLTN